MVEIVGVVENSQVSPSIPNHYQLICHHREWNRVY